MFRQNTEIPSSEEQVFAAKAGESYYEAAAFKSGGMGAKLLIRIETGAGAARSYRIRQAAGNPAREGSPAVFGEPAPRHAKHMLSPAKRCTKVSFYSRYIKRYEEYN